MIVGSLNSSIIRRVFMCMYTSLRGKNNRSQSKSEFQMLISGRHVGVPRKDTNTGVCILSSINLRGTFLQITEERCTAQT